MIQVLSRLAFAKLSALVLAVRARYEAEPDLGRHRQAVMSARQQDNRPMAKLDSRQFAEIVVRRTFRIDILPRLDAFGMQDGRAVRSWPNLRANVAVFKFARS